MKSKLGIHYPNAMFRNMDRFYSIQWGAATFLHFQRADIRGFRWHYPGALILIRGYIENWYHPDHATMLENGRQWARECARWMEEQRPYTNHLTWANEQNLRDAGHPDGAGSGNGDYPPAKPVHDDDGNIIEWSCQLYEDMCDWNIAVIQELRQLIPWAQLHFPALSQGHSDDQDDAGYVGFEILRPAVEMCDVLDAHTYWEADIPGAGYDSEWYGRRYEKVHALFPDKPLFVSEWAPHLPSSPNAPSQIKPWLDTLPDYILGTAFFIWDSDSVNQPWIIQDQLAMIGAMQSYAPSEPQPPNGGTVPDYVVPLGKNPEGNEWPQFRVQRYTGAEEHFELVDWGHEDNTGWSGLLVITLDENDKMLPGVKASYFWPQPRKDEPFDGFRDVLTEMKDLDGKALKEIAPQFVARLANCGLYSDAIGLEQVKEVAVAQFVVNPADSSFDSNGMGPHNARILPLSDVFYGSGTEGNRHYQDMLVFKRILKGSQPPPPQPGTIEQAIEELDSAETALLTAQASVKDARALLQGLIE